MPYIPSSEWKENADFAIEELTSTDAGAGFLHLAHLRAGPLNYLITRLVLRWLGDHPNYERYNAAVGVLESAKLELYRRAVAPYEDAKIKENGDVYDSH